MQDFSRFIRGLNSEGHPEVTLGPWTGPTRFDDAAREYQAARTGAGLSDRSYRGLLEIAGRDRAAWLHNLTTNDVKSLQPGQGHYAFAVNVQGRILFDMNVLARPQALGVDIDRRWITTAQAHFAKYTIMEDVTVTDRSDEFARLALTGDAVPDVLEALGAAAVEPLAPLQLGLVNVSGIDCDFLRHDLGGDLGVELFVPAGRAPAVWNSLISMDAVTPVGFDALNTRRIECAIPWPISEITDEVLPAETNHLERAVNIHKGCYLGQEVVERMRSRGSIARRLTLLEFEGDRPPVCGARVLNDGQTVGRITSACHSMIHHGPAALAYVRTPQTEVGTRLLVESAGDHLVGLVVGPQRTTQ